MGSVNSLVEDLNLDHHIHFLRLLAQSAVAFQYNDRISAEVQDSQRLS